MEVISAAEGRLYRIGKTDEMMCTGCGFVNRVYILKKRRSIAACLQRFLSRSVHQVCVAAGYIAISLGLVMA